MTSRIGAGKKDLRTIIRVRLKELKHLERVFGWNGYSRQQFNRASRPRNIDLRRQQTEDVEEKVGWTCLPYILKVHR